LSDARIFKPTGIPFSELEVVEIATDEFEAMRICDVEKKSQIDASGMMQISRGTVQRLLESGRFKIMNALLTGKAIKINNQ
jgi:predicted DNA-binding protein (UPF0251 family)